MNFERLSEGFAIRQRWEKDKSISREERRSLIEQWAEIFEEADKEYRRARISTSNGDLFPCYLLKTSERTEGDFTHRTARAICLYGEFDCELRDDGIWVSSGLTTFLKQQRDKQE